MEEEVKAEKSDGRKFRFLFVLEVALILALCVLVGFVIAGKAPWQQGETKILGVEATDVVDGVVKPGSHFLVKAENGSVETVRKAIYLEPAIDYEIVEKSAGSEYEIVPSSNLEDNIVLNIDAVSNEVIAYKWAFQTKKELSVTKVYPANGATYVAKNSVIEFTFSYPDVEDVESHFSINPKVDGKLTRNGRVWRFTPSSPLAENASYEITISAGLKYGEEIMKTDFRSSFSTYARANTSYNNNNLGLTLDNTYVFTESEAPVIPFTDVNAFNDSTKLTVYKFNNPDDYIKFVQEGKGEGEKVGDYTFRKVSENANEYYATRLAMLNNTLPTGYYVLRFMNASEQNTYTTNIQINNINAYALETERDVLVWTAKDGQLASDVDVKYKDKDYKTDGDGLLIIKDVSDFSEKINYLKIGGSNQPLVIAIENFENDLYPSGFIYTDRLLYKPTDTVRVWGYVPIKFFRDYPNRENFSVTFGTIKKNVTIDEDGYFSTKIDLENYKDSDINMTLEYNDSILARRSVAVEDYSLENYTYTIVSDKNYINSGENIKFKVKVEHVTGFPAVSKDIVVTYKNHDYYYTTNGAGEASVSIPTIREVTTVNNESNSHTEYLEIKSGGAEYNKYATGYRVTAFRNNMVFNSSKDDDKKELTFKAKVLDLSKNKKINSDSDLESSNYSGPATLRLYEKRVSRSIERYYYNEYRKENVPVYKISSVDTVIKEIPVEFKDGVLTYTYDTEYKDSEQNVYYAYFAKVFASDSTGRPAISYNLTYHQGNFLGEEATTPDDKYNAIYGTYMIDQPALNHQYYYYRFGLKDQSHDYNLGLKYGYASYRYSIGDVLKLGLYDGGGTNVQNNGKVLAVAIKENVVYTNVFSDDTLDVKFDQNLYPGVDIAGAYFMNGRFYRIAPYYYDYNHEDSELTVKITADKDSYQPGDMVKAKVVVERADGTRVDKARVNLSVVNEAIFNARNDNTSILTSIYENKKYKLYSMSTFFDYELLASDGGLGGADGGRADFGDTLYFGEKVLNNGEAEFEFKLNDSITSFRLTAVAVENGDVINAGAGKANVSSYLPLSLSTVMPKKVKNTDDVVLNATTIVASGDEISYEFRIDEIDKTKTMTSTAGKNVFSNFGKLEVGKYTVHIKGRDSAGNEDHMVHELEVVETAQEVAVKKTVEIENDSSITPVKNPIIVEIYDKNTKQYLTYLDHLKNNYTVRLDTQIAYYKSLEFSDKYYNEKSSTVKPDFKKYLTNSGLLKPLENAEGDYVLTALANFYAPEYFKLKASNFGLSINDNTSTLVKKLLVLASFKEPVLLELKAVQNAGGLDDEDNIILGLAFAMIGDYDSAKVIYEYAARDVGLNDLIAILATMINKNDATNQINNVMTEDSSADYLDFAIISFFINNETDLSKKNEVTIKTGAGEEKIEVTPLVVAKKVFYMDEISDLKFSTSSKELLTTYYYQGKLSELGEDFTTDIVASLEGNRTRNSNVTLVLDISKLDGKTRNGELNIALPSGLKLSGTFSGLDGLYMTRNNNEYFKLSLSERYTSNMIRIPLYVTAPGDYEIEPVVFINNGEYHISNSLTIDLK